MRSYYSKLFFSLLLSALASLANAKSDVSSNWYMDVGLGWMFNQKIGTTYLANLYDIPADQYNAPKLEQVPIGFLSGGYVWPRQTVWLPFISLGLEYSYVFPAKAKGLIAEFSEADFTDFKYEYEMAHSNLYLVGKVDLVRWKNCMPYLSGGFGASWNHFSAYSEQALVADDARLSPAFPNKTKLSVSYSLGAGLDYIFTTNLWGSLGYRYDHFGRGETGDTTHTEFLGKNLNDSVQAHTVIFSLRYLF